MRKVAGTAGTPEEPPWWNWGTKLGFIAKLLQNFLLLLRRSSWGSIILHLSWLCLTSSYWSPKPAGNVIVTRQTRSILPLRFSKKIIWDWHLFCASWMLPYFVAINHEAKQLKYEASTVILPHWCCLNNVATNWLCLIYARNWDIKRMFNI